MSEIQCPNCEGRGYIPHSVIQYVSRDMAADAGNMAYEGLPIFHEVQEQCDVSVTQDVLINSKTSLPVKSDELRKDDTCPDCEGSGEVSCETWFNDDGMTPCDRCNGKGLI